MNNVAISTSSRVFENNLQAITVYVYEGRFSQLNPKELSVSDTHIGHGMARNMSYLNQYAPVTSLHGTTLISLYPLEQQQGQWKFENQTYDYTAFSKGELTLDLHNEAHRHALQKLIKHQVYLTIYNQVKFTHTVELKSTHIAIVSKKPSEHQSDIGVQVQLTLLLDVDVLPTGECVTYFDLKHTLIMPPEYNLDWIIRHQPTWLDNIKQVKSFIGADAVYEFLGIRQDLTPLDAVPMMQTSFIDYHLGRGNISQDDAPKYEHSHIVETKNKTTSICHIAAFLSPLITLETLTELDPTFVKVTLPKLRFASNKRFDTIQKIIGKLKLGDIVFPVVGKLNSSLSVEQLPSTRFQYHNIKPRLAIGNGEVTSFVKDVIKFGAYKGCTRNWFIPIVYQPNPDQGLSKSDLAKVMQGFKNTLDQICPKEDMPRHDRLKIVRAQDELISLARAIENPHKTMMLVINCDTNPESYTQIRNVLFGNGIAHQFMSGNHAVAKYDDYYWANLVAGVFSKAGGILSKMINMPKPHQLFIGIDLGGQRLRAVGSAMLMTSEGNLLGWTLNDSQNGEKLPERILRNLVLSAIAQYQQAYGQKPSHVCIHRDGLFNEDLQTIIDIEQSESCQIDVVEIIKSGAPRLYRDHGNKNAMQGDVLIVGDKKTAIVVPHSLGKMPATPRSLKVRQRYGQTPFDVIIDQIILLTYVHGSSLFRPTRLPATTHHSHNFATMLQQQSLDSISRMDRFCPIYL